MMEIYILGNKKIHFYIYFYVAFTGYGEAILSLRGRFILQSSVNKDGKIDRSIK